jgi:hypothetical protein
MTLKYEFHTYTYRRGWENSMGKAGWPYGVCVAYGPAGHHYLVPQHCNYSIRTWFWEPEA